MNQSHTDKFETRYRHKRYICLHKSTIIDLHPFRFARSIITSGTRDYNVANVFRTDRVLSQSFSRFHPVTD